MNVPVLEFGEAMAGNDGTLSRDASGCVYDGEI
jgi:hypothetical protein